MLNISEIVAKTEAMFDLFNAHFYNNELQRAAITVSPDNGQRFKTQKIKRAGCFAITKYPAFFR